MFREVMICLFLSVRKRVHFFGACIMIAGLTIPVKIADAAMQMVLAVIVYSLFLVMAAVLIPVLLAGIRYSVFFLLILVSDLLNIRILWLVGSSG